MLSCSVGYLSFPDCRQAGLILLIFPLALSCHFRTRGHIHFTPCIEYVKYIHHKPRKRDPYGLPPLHRYQADRRPARLHDLLSSHRRTSMGRRLTTNCRSCDPTHDDHRIDDCMAYPQTNHATLYVPLALSQTVTLCQYQYFSPYRLMVWTESARYHQLVNRSY